MFSIIIPIYNIQDYLHECLESLCQQCKDFNIEIFLVDDGSTDNSGLIAKEYSQNYPQLFKYFYKTNGGLSDARNYAIPFANNEYTLFIDSDDYLSDTALKMLFNIVHEHHPDLIIFDYIMKWSNKEKIIQISSSEEGYISKTDYLLMNPAAWNKIVKTNILKNNHILFPKGLWYEDRATTATYINYCETIYYVKQPLYYYRQRENSIMKQNTFDKRMLDIITAMKMFDQQISDKEHYQEKEYLFISNLLFQNALRLVPLKRYSEIKSSYHILKTRYPRWKRNKYFNLQSFGYKFICYLISWRLYPLSRKFINIKLKGQ